MVKGTIVFNDTDANIELKQGSANVFHPLHSLPKGKSYKIKVDESATYSEYWCVVQPDSAYRVVFSSDDCNEFSKVRIYKDKDKKYKWIGTEKRGAWLNTSVPPPAQPQVQPQVQPPDQPPVTPLVQDGETPARWQRFTRFFGKRN